MSEAAAAVAVEPRKAPPAPPVEVVLPLAYYGLLVLEAIGLVVMHYKIPDRSASQGYSYIFGWVGLGSMTVMHVYSLRRRLKAFRGLGKIRYWLHFHIFMGLQGALLVTYHSLNLQAPASIQGINIICVGIVVVSGMFGRYLYALIPKSLAGDRLSASEVEAELEKLGASEAAPTPELARAMESYTKDVHRLTQVSFGQLVKEDLRARRALREIDAALKSNAQKVTDPAAHEKLQAFVAVSRRRMMLTRRLATLHAADRLFLYWTLLHKPLTFLLAGATILHILSHYMYASGMSG